ncbi:hypothetical protein ACFQH3_05630 [Haladaptatus sp. GCM10025707]|uniref:DUF7344 domain-containing protein n=1 Tax=unclassified Haladaptatus TaxID=2622732 RepID=UPI0023E89DC3|nr:MULTISPECIES: hypothetical protein [unclassified Haladaptatus]
MTRLADGVSMITGELDTGEIHDVLRNDRRRLALNALRDAGGELSVRTLSELVAEHETSQSPPPKNIRQSVYVSLHQTHLPKLADLDIVEYDEEHKVVRLANRVGEVEAYMTIEPEYGLTWTEYYFGVAALGLVTVGATVTDVPYVSQVAVEVWSATWFVCICVAAGYQLLTRDESLGDRL